MPWQRGVPSYPTFPGKCSLLCSGHLPAASPPPSSCYSSFFRLLAGPQQASEWGVPQNLAVHNRDESTASPEGRAHPQRGGTRGCCGEEQWHRDTGRNWEGNGREICRKLAFTGSAAHSSQILHRTGSKPKPFKETCILSKVSAGKINQPS